MVLGLTGGLALLFTVVATWTVAQAITDVRVELAEFKGATTCTVERQGTQLEQLQQRVDQLEQEKGA